MQTCRILVPLYSAYQPRLHQKFHSSASVMKSTNEIRFLIVMAAYIYIYICDPLSENPALPANIEFEL